MESRCTCVTYRCSNTTGIPLSDVPWGSVIHACKLCMEYGNFTASLHEVTLFVLYKTCCHGNHAKCRYCTYTDIALHLVVNGYSAIRLPIYIAPHRRGESRGRPADAQGMNGLFLP
jgi:hypothetical protein